MLINKILIIGFGSIGKRHYENLKKINSKFEITFLCRKSSKKSFHEANFIHKISDIKLIKPDCALICNPSSMHIESAIYLIDNNINFFVEKPLSNSIEKLEILNERVSKKNIKAMVGFNLRFNRCILKMKEIINSKKFGNILSIKIEVGQFLPLWRKGINYQNYVSSNKKLGGGALLELSHEIDYLQWIFGRAKSVTSNLKKVSSMDIDVEDIVNAIIEIDIDGKDIPCTVHLDFLQHKKVRNCKVMFDDFTLNLDLVKDCIEVYQNEKIVYSYNEPQNPNTMYINEIEEFLNYLNNDIKSPISIAEGIKAQHLIDLIYKSSIDKKRVICE